VQERSIAPCILETRRRNAVQWLASWPDSFIPG
jgi:hypothetical protein